LGQHFREYGSVESPVRVIQWQIFGRSDGNSEHTVWTAVAGIRRIKQTLASGYFSANAGTFRGPDARWTESQLSQKFSGHKAWPMDDVRSEYPCSESDDHESSSSPRDFDFLLGTWFVHHKRLKTRLANCCTWERFRGRCSVLSILGGHGTVDENFIDLPGGPYHATTVRCFDGQSRVWEIWWFDGRHPLQLEKPLSGRFRDGLGVFFGEELFEGRPIRVRCIWSNITATSARWQQAFSPDAGATWETNWTMEFERARSDVSTRFQILTSDLLSCRNFEANAWLWKRARPA
jgi:hypothetical protein